MNTLQRNVSTKETLLCQTEKTPKKFPDTVLQLLDVSKREYSRYYDLVTNTLLLENTSRGVNAFGPIFLALQLVRFWKLSGELPIISVGAGSGLIEALAMIIEPTLQIISVDPLKDGDFTEDCLSPEDFFYLRPQFEDVDALLLEKGEELIKKCSVALIWPDPSLSYDVDAIEKLRPHSVFVVHERDGAGGSQSFHFWRESDEQVEEFPFSQEVTTLTPIFDAIINRKMRLSLLILSKNQIDGEPTQEIESPYQMSEGERNYQMMIALLMSSRR